MRVLILDDTPQVAQMLKQVVRHIGGRDATAVTRDFAACLQPEVWEGVDVAVIDYMLGGKVTGLDIAAWLAEHVPRVRRVLLTAAVLPAPVLAEAERLCDRVLYKPSPIAELLEAISE